MNNADIYETVRRMHLGGTYAATEHDRSQHATDLLGYLDGLTRADLIGLIGDVFDRLHDMELANALLARGGIATRRATAGGGEPRG